jgi:hypothetical protein
LNKSDLPQGLKDIIEKMQLIQSEDFNRDFNFLNENINLFLLKYKLVGIKSTFINNEVKSSLIFDEVCLNTVDL